MFLGTLQIGPTQKYIKILKPEYLFILKMRPIWGIVALFVKEQHSSKVNVLFPSKKIQIFQIVDHHLSPNNTLFLVADTSQT